MNKNASSQSEFTDKNASSQSESAIQAQGQQGGVGDDCFILSD